MSLKSIELQLAIPKTQELGKLQNEMHQRTMINQALLTSQIKQQELRKKKRTEKMTQADLKEQNTTRTPKVKDVYRGNHVDIEL